MIPIWFFCLLFGIFIIVYPQFLAYMIGFFFIALGINVIVMRYIFRSRMTRSQGGFHVGGYEILRRK